MEGQITTNDTHEFSPLREDEPTFTIRGKDARAIEVLRAIQRLGYYSRAGMDMNIARFERWATEHLDDMKLPD